MSYQVLRVPPATRLADLIVFLRGNMVGGEDMRRRMRGVRNFFLPFPYAPFFELSI